MYNCAHVLFSLAADFSKCHHYSSLYTVFDDKCCPFCFQGDLINGSGSTFMLPVSQPINSSQCIYAYGVCICMCICMYVLCM